MCDVLFANLHAHTQGVRKNGALSLSTPCNGARSVRPKLPPHVVGSHIRVEVFVRRVFFFLECQHDVFIR